VRARSRTSSQTSSLGPPPRGKRVAPVPPGRRRPTTDDRDRRRRARAFAPSPARRILFTPRARSGRYFPVSALRRIPPCARHFRALERFRRPRVSDDRARGRDVARDDRDRHRARATIDASARRIATRRESHLIHTEGFDMTGRSRAATRGRRARATRPTKDARGRAIGIVCACVLLASVATAQRWVRETRRGEGSARGRRGEREDARRSSSERAIEGPMGGPTD